ncbi:anti-sigma factor [Rhodanobacter glycinis]|uniref:Anti-sigma factor n=1 Tax=Rhodanobacter glycinis TaxID=582702 RepID=A0A5B9E1B2_9GAMM|nr:anti-sigma factor [Rhodanobacter glycinis]QEE25334.1 anti-sigma factor [Rhodanobacter glycinis]
MNTPIDDNNHNLRYAEYVLGVLDADARAEVAHEMLASDEVATAVALWQSRLLPLTESIEDVAPAPYVWARIHDALKLDVSASTPARAAPRPRLWDNLALWHWLGLGASAVAVALLLVVALPRHANVTSPSATSVAYMASTIKQDNGATGWTATMDLQHSRMIVVPAAPQALAQGKAPELWLIPAGQKPIAVGMISREQPTTLALAPALLKQLGATAALAVSVEPPGGSPTGQPTGPVIAKGAIGAAPDVQGNKVAMNGDGHVERTRA